MCKDPQAKVLVRDPRDTDKDAAYKRATQTNPTAEDHIVVKVVLGFQRLQCRNHPRL
jgi:hypothetical protein